MNDPMNETPGRINEHEPAPMIEKIKCNQNGGIAVDIRLAKSCLDMTDKTCQDCKRCIP